MKLSNELIETYCAGIEKGLSYEGACGASGIHRTSRIRWRDNAQRVIENLDDGTWKENELSTYDELCVVFYHRDNEAQAKVEERMIARIQTAADDGTWQAAAWFLERRYPERYGRYRKQVQDVVEDVDTPVSVDVDKVAIARNRVKQNLEKVKGAGDSVI